MRTRILVYLILLSARGGRENVVEGLRAGADDDLIKPFDKDELRARIDVGLRTMSSHAVVAARADRLVAEMAELRGHKLELVM